MPYIKDQKGFTAVEIVLVIALLAVIGVAGYYAYQNMQNHSSSTSKTTMTPKPSASSSPAFKGTAYTDPGGYFSFEYPTGWTVQTNPLGGGAFFLDKAEDTITDLWGPGVGTKDPVVASVTAYKAKTNLADFKKGEESEAAPNHITITDATVNGQAAFLETHDQTGYKTLTYYVGKGAYIVGVEFSVKNTNPNFDYSKYQPDFENIVQTLKILK